MAIDLDLSFPCSGGLVSSELCGSDVDGCHVRSHRMVPISRYVGVAHALTWQPEAEACGARGLVC